MSNSYFSLNSQIENKAPLNNLNLSYFNFLNQVRNKKWEVRNKKWEMGNQEFGSWIWKGIELGPEKWEMGTKSEFSSLKVRPLESRNLAGIVT